jgi:nucleoside-diphosphate-sugar epimerase
MKIVVTGASGHLGKAVMRELSARHEVKGYSSAELDITRDVTLEPCDALVHLAAWHPPATASTRAEDRARLLEVNVLGTMRVLDASRATNVVYASTFEVYGLPVASPIDEDHPTRPVTDYGATKLSGEDHALAYAYEEKARVVCLRMPAI